jgi:hypothetical protein
MPYVFGLLRMRLKVSNAEKVRTRASGWAEANCCTDWRRPEFQLRYVALMSEEAVVPVGRQVG